MVACPLVRAVCVTPEDQLTVQLPAVSPAVVVSTCLGSAEQRRELFGGILGGEMGCRGRGFAWPEFPKNYQKNYGNYFFYCEYFLFYSFWWWKN